MADIREGDKLTAAGVTYVVKAAFVWSNAKTSIDPRFALRDAVAYTTTRNPTAVSDKIAGQTTGTSGYCLPVMPADIRILDRAGISGDALAGFGRMMVTYIADGTEVLMFEERP